MIRALAIAALLGLSQPLLAREKATWRPVDAETGQIRDVDGLTALAAAFPDSGSVRLRLLQAQIGADDVEGAMLSLEWLYDRGYLFSEGAKARISTLFEGIDPGRIAERLRAEAEVIGSSEVVAVVPAGAGLVETVVSTDEDGGVFVVTSITEQAAFASLGGVDWQRLDLSLANDLSGLVSDEVRDIGWFASSNIDESEGGEGRFSGLIGLSSTQDEPILIRAPSDVAISDLGLGSDGTVYASAPLDGGVYYANQESEYLEELVPSGVLRSPQGLATSEDNSKLYVSDYRYGIAIVDLNTREVSRLSTDLPLILDGVDGIWRHGNELIAVQNGTSPMRISAFALSDDGSSIIAARILEQANPEWTEPLGGSLDGESLIYIGNGQWDKFIKGEPVEGRPLVPSQIRRLKL